MSLPLRVAHAGKSGRAAIVLTAEGLGIEGKREPSLDLVVELWDALVSALALEEIDLSRQVKLSGHAMRVAEARAALQVRLSGSPRHK